MWPVFEIAAMVLFVASCCMAYWCSITGHLKYACLNLLFAIINVAVIFVARMAQAGLL